jgi:4'-phosphopantetheinyl transferase
MEVYWLEQTADDVPEKNDWLSRSEVFSLDKLRFAKRRADWRLGRWTAKSALAAHSNSSSSPSALAEIEIWPAPSGAPEALFKNKLAPVTISLSHRDSRAICAVGPAAIELGCDLELIEPRSDAFIADYFATQEQELIARQTAEDRLRILALLWSGKESALKALHTGLRLDTRCVIVEPVDISFLNNGWSPFRVRYDGCRIFHGWWCVAGYLVRTLVAAPPPSLPILLQTRPHFHDAAPRCPFIGRLVGERGDWERLDFSRVKKARNLPPSSVDAADG